LLGGTVTSALCDLTLSELRAAGITPALEPDGTLRITARNAEVGDIIVSFEGDEISVFLGDITHCHFTPYAAQDNFPGCTPTEAAADASQFIREVVSDQWVIWRWRDGRGGCFKLGGNDDEGADAPLPGEEVESFVWSGRLVPPNKSFERTREG
jgi:hypothetical protein